MLGTPGELFLDSKLRDLSTARGPFGGMGSRETKVFDEFIDIKLLPL